MNHLIRLSTLAGALLLAGCISVGPDYHRPAEKPVALQGIDTTHAEALRRFL